MREPRVNDADFMNGIAHVLTYDLHRYLTVDQIDRLYALANDAETWKARADRAEAALAQAGKVTEEMVSAGVQAYATEINSKRSLSVHRLLKIALEAALNARKEG